MNRFAGTWTLTRLALRRDRFMLPAWVLTFVAVVAFTSAAAKDLYPTQTALERVGRSWNATTAFVAMHGRIYDVSSLGAGTLVKMTGLGTAMVGLLAILLVVRHTRADEEVGRTELAAGGVVGQYAALAAAGVVSVGTVVTLSAASGVALLLSGLPVAGSVAFALSWAATGTVFAGVGAVAAQVAVGARAARGLAAAALGALYAVRAVGDTAPEDGARWVAWLSPLGWGQQVRPFAGDRWWVLVLPLVATIVLAATALFLLRRRDLGAGILTDRPGPPRAPRLTSPLALAWRVQRATFAAWLAGTVGMGLLLGSIAATVGDLLESTGMREYVELLGGVTYLEDAFLSAELTIAAVIVSAFGIGAAMRMRNDEAQGRAEALLATGVPRTRYAVAHLVVALAGVTLLLGAVGLSIGLTHAVATGDVAQVGRVAGAALARVPAAWVMTSSVMLVFGLSGRLTPLAWVLLVAFIVVGEFGPLMDLPSWTLDLSPFTHVPPLPGGDLDLVPLVVLTTLSGVLVGVGLAAFRRRDLQPD